MPHSVAITGNRYGGEYTVYTVREAEDRGIKYFTPPFPPIEVPCAGWVLTSNNYVVPILNSVHRGVGKGYMDYITPFGRHRYFEMPFMDGRTHTRGVTMNHYSDDSLDKRNMAHWMARYGDPHEAHLMAYGYAAPPNLDELIRDPQFQIILEAERNKLSEELGIPHDFIIQQRMRQTTMLTDLMSKWKDKLIAKMEADIDFTPDEQAAMNMFLTMFKDQQSNVTDMETGYIRTQAMTENPGVLERSYTERMQLPGRGGNGFHLTPTVKQDGVVAHLAEGEKLEHPDGYHDPDYDNIDDVLLDTQDEA